MLGSSIFCCRHRLSFIVGVKDSKYIRSLGLRTHCNLIILLMNMMEKSRLIKMRLKCAIVRR